MSKKQDITKLDLYGIIGIAEDATEKQIVKAYRKQALKCHPDKNPDNPTAAEQFHQLSQALDVLTDAAARAAYDKVLKAKKAAAHRHRQYDAKRKKFKDDLDARERAATDQKQEKVDDAVKLQQEIERLRKEGNKILEEVQEQLRKDVEEKLAMGDNDDGGSDDGADATTAKLKVKWKIQKGETRDEGYTKQELEDMFSKCGEVLNMVMIVKKSGTAIVEYASSYSAELACNSVKGKPEFPLTITWLSGQPPRGRVGVDRDPGGDCNEESATGDIPAFTPAFTQESFSGPATSDNRDYESLVLMKMRQAQERKRIIEEMQKEDGDGT